MFDGLFPKKFIKKHSDEGSRTIFRGYSKNKEKISSIRSNFFRTTWLISTECRLPDPWSMRFEFNQMEQLKLNRHTHTIKSLHVLELKVGNV